MNQTSYVDAYRDAAFVLSETGLVTLPANASGKILVGCYAILGGLLFFAVIAAILGPIIHRFFHRSYLNGKNEY